MTSAGKTPSNKAIEHYREYWKRLTVEGDPLRIPNPFQKSFLAGWEAAEQSTHAGEMAELLAKAVRQWQRGDNIDIGADAERLLAELERES